MIHFGEHALELSREVCKALLAFASTDKTRVHLYAVGFNNGDLCAVNGVAAVRFTKTTGDCSIVNVNDKSWPRSYVELQLKIAVARKEPTVLLAWSELRNLTLPALHQVEVAPDDYCLKVQGNAAVGLDAAVFAAMFLVQEACKRDKEFRKDHPFEPMRLVHVTSTVEPLTFECGSQRSKHHAKVTVMPCQSE